MPEESALLIGRVAFAMAIGFLIGLERGWQGRAEADGAQLAGVRTYSLYGMLGGIAGVLPDTFILPAAIAGAAVLIAAGYIGSLQEAEPDRGMTSEVAALAVVLLGAAAGRGDMLLAAAGAVLVVLLLNLKDRLHLFVNLIRRDELTAGIRLLAISVLILPFLPDQGFGPGGVLNPRQIWWGVVIVAGLSFAGYVAIRTFGARRGPLAFGFFGGLASSTAVTVTASRLARANDGLASSFAGAIGLASAVMMGRIAVLTAGFAPALFQAIWPTLAVAAAATIGVALALHWFGPKPDGPQDGLDMKPPEDIGFAVAFGAMLAVIGLGVHFAEIYLGHAGLLAMAVISGPFDVDAFALSLARASGVEMDIAAARDAVLLCVGINTVGKAVIAYVMGGPAVAWRVAAFMAASVVAGAAMWATGWAV